MTDLTPEKLLELQKIDESLFVWMTVHGYLSLALRHPGAQGAAREYAEAFVRKLGRILVERGVFSQAELDHIEQVEKDERTRQAH